MVRSSPRTEHGRRHDRVGEATLIESQVDPDLVRPPKRSPVRLELPIWSRRNGNRTDDCDSWCTEAPRRTGNRLTLCRRTCCGLRSQSRHPRRRVALLWLVASYSAGMASLAILGRALSPRRRHDPHRQFVYYAECGTSPICCPSRSMSTWTVTRTAWSPSKVTMSISSYSTNSPVGVRPSGPGPSIVPVTCQR